MDITPIQTYPLSDYFQLMNPIWYNIMTRKQESYLLELCYSKTTSYNGLSDQLLDTMAIHIFTGIKFKYFYTSV